jgi:hypothetical protein
MLGALAYVALPPLLAGLERDGALPEDLRRRKRELHDRLYLAISGRSELVKTIAMRVLVPYSRAPLGSLRQLLPPRTISDEQARVRRRIDAMLQGRGEGRLDGLEELVRIVVDLRVLPLRRALGLLLRAWLPIHVVMSAVAAALLALHVVWMVGK